MNARQDFTVKSASGPDPLVSALAATGAQLGQHLKNLRAIQAEYDTMLYMVEFLVSSHLPNATNPEQVKTMENLKSLVIQERNGLGLRQAEKH